MCTIYRILYENYLQNFANNTTLLSWEISTADNNKLYDFCCQWLKSWNGAPRSDHSNHEVLNNCKTTDLPQVRGADACPSIRYCPTCGHFSLQSFQGIIFKLCVMIEKTNNSSSWINSGENRVKITANVKTLY